MKVSINISGLRWRANQLSTGSENLKSESQKLLGLVDSVNNVWKGHDSVKYINTMRNEYVKTLNDLCKVLDQNTIYLRTIASRYGKIGDK